MHQTQSRKLLEDILEEHRALRDTTADLIEFCEHPRPEVEADEATAWASDLAQRLVKFHDQVYRHFHEEESSGFFEELCHAHPHASRPVARLEGDHERILKDLRSVLDAAILYGENKAPVRQNLRQWTLSLLDHLARHEHEETELIQRLISEDLGVGD